MDKSSHYAVSMDCPHATKPDVLWDVSVPEECVRPEGHADEYFSPKLWVPRLETWTLDTLRMVLHELAAYLPPHDDAQVTILAKTNRPTGRARADGRPHAPRFNDRVEIEVCARGWTVHVRTDRNERTNEKGAVDRVWDTGAWTEPMQAVLLDLAAKSPFPLSIVRPVDAGDPRVLGLAHASRRDVSKGREPSAELTTKSESRKQRIKRLIDDALDSAA